MTSEPPTTRWFQKGDHALPLSVVSVLISSCSKEPCLRFETSAGAVATKAWLNCSRFWLRRGTAPKVQRFVWCQHPRMLFAQGAGLWPLERRWIPLLGTWGFRCIQLVLPQICSASEWRLLGPSRLSWFSQLVMRRCRVLIPVVRSWRMERRQQWTSIQVSCQLVLRALATTTHPYIQRGLSSVLARTCATYALRIQTSTRATTISHQFIQRGRSSVLARILATFALWRQTFTRASIQQGHSSVLARTSQGRN